MIRAAITATGHAVPEDKLTNADLEKLVETNDEWIRTRTGISERRILKDKTKGASYLASLAAQEVLQKRGIDATEIDCILVATVTPDMLFPSTACLVQKNIGATNAWGFDVSAACSGFLFALSTGTSFIESGQSKKVLVIGVDIMSSIVDYTDRSTCILFGDAAAAVLLEPTEENVGIIDSVKYIDGNEWEYLCMLGGGSLNPPSHETVDNKMHFLHQEGRPVYKLAVSGMKNASLEIMERNNLQGEDIAYLVPHQANLRIIEATANRMNLPMERVTINIDRYGNTTAATIPLCLYEWESKFKKGDNIVLAAFGGGYTWGATLVKWAYDTK